MMERFWLVIERIINKLKGKHMATDPTPVPPPAAPSPAPAPQPDGGGGPGEEQK